jgi:hypothetical protein
MSPPELLALAQAACHALCRALPAHYRLHTPPGVVWMLGQHAVFQVTVWARLLPGKWPQLAPTAASTTPPTARPLLVTEYVEETMGEQLRAQGICYLDAAGNAWLQHPAARELFVLVQGRPRYKRPVVPGAAFRRDGLRVVFRALTHPPALARPDTELAAELGLTPHVLAGVLADLQAQGLLASAPRRLLVSPALVERWVSAYGPGLRPRLNPERYRWLDPARAAHWRELPLGHWGAWSGEAAAQLLLGEEGELPTRLIIYSAEDREALCQRLGLKPHPRGQVELLRPFGEAFAPPQPGPACVHPLVVCADLRLTPTPAAASLAQRLAQRYLAGLAAPGQPDNNG